MTIDLPLAAYVPETYVADLNLRLSLYQRMAAAEALDAHEDLERELIDRFGTPPPPVRSLLYIVRVRVLAKRAGIGTIATEDSGGRTMVVVRAPDGEDLRARMAAGARRELESSGGVAVGHNQVRLDIEALGDGWREQLVAALQALEQAEALVAAS
jgi:transcription-repair coupling factor (superfamily II helicase)